MTLPSNRQDRGKINEHGPDYLDSGVDRTRRLSESCAAQRFSALVFADDRGREGA